MMPSSLRLPSVTAAVIVAGLAAVMAPGARASEPAAQIVVRPAAGRDASSLRHAIHASGAHIVGTASGGRTVVQAADADAVDRTVAALRRAPAVASAGPRLIARVAAAPVPDDTGVAARSAEAAGGWAQVQWDLTGPLGVHAPDAWAIAGAVGRQPGAGVTVGVIDTGLAYADRPPYRRSPDILPTHVARGYDLVDNDPFPNDRNGHGTFVASTIIAAENNNYGMVGIAWGARVMPVRALNGDGVGTAARIASGMRWAVDHGADVINVSIELVDRITAQPQTMTVDPQIREAVRYAAAHDVLVVAAAGNSASPDVPSTRLGSDILYVGGSTEHGCLGDYSNFGHGVDLVAPGGGGDSQIAGDPHCQPDATRGRNVEQVSFKRPFIGRFRIIGDRTGRPGLAGTSMAAPHASAVAALVLASGVLGPHPTPAKLQQRIVSTAQSLGPGAPPRYYGAGLLDAAAALRGTQSPPAPAPTLSG
jgi:serine protease